MDTNIQRALNDKLYDKRKVGALEYVYYFFFPESGVPALGTHHSHRLPSTGSNALSASRSPLKITPRSKPSSTSSATSMHMLSINRMPETVA